MYKIPVKKQKNEFGFTLETIIDVVLPNENSNKYS